ncbi:copper amine oxidase N-terminal domain-containing protein [Brevibacillus humidisoli]|uniref:stalk domain-containing protein n=1 Tax=Brevibacillus humidisoli TaxID=2895522 RepID=UPI001E2D457D|nr:stalk domain-containing protein [Brevibacillus humidisoli]UFJ40172.1 copper amine oxidase N-terminal domain-containing protein [Brevibacillus humidisoli]
MGKLHVKSFVSGVCIGSVLFAGMAYASASKVLSLDVVQMPTTFYFDGIPKSPPEGHESFLYKNTNYVPLRFIAENLGESVIYDAKTASVYIGELPSVQMLSKLQAVELVRQLNSQQLPPNAIVEYHHTNENGHYVIHVYSEYVNNFSTGDSYTRSYGWFVVNPSSGDVQKIL